MWKNVVKWTLFVVTCIVIFVTLNVLRYHSHSGLQEYPRDGFAVDAESYFTLLISIGITFVIYMITVVVGSYIQQHWKTILRCFVTCVVAIGAYTISILLMCFISLVIFLWGGDWNFIPWQFSVGLSLFASLWAGHWAYSGLGKRRFFGGRGIEGRASISRA